MRVFISGAFASASSSSTRPHSSISPSYLRWALAKSACNGVNSPWCAAYSAWWLASCALRWSQSIAAFSAASCDCCSSMSTASLAHCSRSRSSSSRFLLSSLSASDSAFSPCLVACSRCLRASFASLKRCIAARASYAAPSTSTCIDASACALSATSMLRQGGTCSEPVVPMRLKTLYAGFE